MAAWPEEVATDPVVGPVAGRAGWGAEAVLLTLAGDGRADASVAAAVVSSHPAVAWPVRVGPKRTRAAAHCGRPSCERCDERFGDRGSATLWVVGGLAVLMVVVTAVLWFGAAVVARHQAEGAADLAALAAATVAVDGERAACAEARWVVERMEGVLRSCRLSGWDAFVEVEVAFGPFGSAAGRARAGPVEVSG